MMIRSGLALMRLVAWVVKSVSVVWKVWTVTRFRLSVPVTVLWKTTVSDLLNASFWANATATFLMAGLILTAALTAPGAKTVTGTETRET